MDKETLDALSERLGDIETYLHIEQKRQEAARLEKQSSDPSFWNDADAARQTMERLTAAKNDISAIDKAYSDFEDIQVAFSLFQETGDEELGSEAQSLASALTHELDELELASWFSDDLDAGDAIISITPGQGGLEAQDWCNMLLHMYLKYCERRKWKVTINDAPSAEVIGIDHATFTVSGKNAYGMLRAEHGVHRLVRISPTDAKKRRQTTFAGVEVLPVLPESVEVTIDPSDIRVDVFHASGPGGQGVNTTDSAVRLTHLPTGIVVSCQNERSQLQNKTVAMGILRSRLFELEQAKRNDELEELRGPKHDISFGNQIRNYILYPFQLVKDPRTGAETSQVNSVLTEGNLDMFIVAYHRWLQNRKRG